jgi:hypothetical protein
MRQIEDNLLAITNAMFRNKTDWQYVTDEQKEKWFFIINRNFSKKYPDKAQLLNLKTIDKVTSLNLWYNFMLDKPYPSWFWSKGETGEKPKVSDKEFKLLLKRLEIKDLDLNFLIDKHFDFIKEELTYIKKIQEQK